MSQNPWIDQGPGLDDYQVALFRRVTKEDSFHGTSQEGTINAVCVSGPPLTVLIVIGLTRKLPQLGR
jgi:hypothetical protein